MSDYADTADRTYSREEVEAYIRKAHEKGKAAGREEGRQLGEESIKHGLKTLAGLNGSGDAVLRMIRKAERMEARRVERVEKAATFVESEHPRDKTGEFMAKLAVDEAARAMAKGDHAAANKLRESVRPEDAAVLEEHLAHPERNDPTARTGRVRTQREMGEHEGHEVSRWVADTEAAIRSTGHYDHMEIVLRLTAATAGRTPELRRVLRALGTPLKHQPATKEALKAKIWAVLMHRIQVARDEHHLEKIFGPKRYLPHSGPEPWEASPTPAFTAADKEQALALHHERETALADLHSTPAPDAADWAEYDSAEEKRDRMLAWHTLRPSEASAAALARAEARLSRAKGGAMVKALSEDAVLKAKDATGHEHRGAGPGGGQFAKTGGGGDGKKEPAKSATTDKKQPGKPKHKVADAKAMAVVRAAALAKFQAAPKPTAQEARENVKGMRLLGADRFEANARGNSKDRRASRYKLLEEFGDGKTCPCCYCGLMLVGDPEHGANTVERDKIYTAAQGGKYRHGNLVPSCRGCNLARSDKPFKEFFDASHGSNAGQS